MFTYINPDIRERLIRDGKLFRIDADGAEAVSYTHLTLPTKA